MNKEKWDKFWASKSPNDLPPPILDIAEEIQKTVGEVKGLRILEVGAGTGCTGIELAKHQAEMWLLDFSKKSLWLSKIGAKREGVEINLIQSDALSTPFRNDSFDVVYHQGLLEHFKNPLPLIKENYRILKSNGILLVDVPQTFHIYTIIKHIFIFLGKWFAGWERQFTKGTLEKLLKSQGFYIEKEYAAIPRPEFFYKALRKLLGIIGVRLSISQQRVKRKRLNSWLKKMRYKKFALYLALSIGIIGRKP